MKKAKLILAAIAVFAVIGGVYATKASRVGKFVYLRAEGETTCSLLLTEANTTYFVIGQPTIAHTTATLVKGPCTSVFDIYTAP